MNASDPNCSEKHSSMADDIMKAVQVHFLSIDHYMHGDRHAKVDKIENPSNRLRNIDDDYCHPLAES